MTTKILAWIGRIVGWALIGFVILVVPCFTISILAVKSENPENMLLPYVIMMVAMPFSFFLGIAGGMIAQKFSKKDTKGIFGSVVGGLLSPILALVIFLIDSDLAAKFYLHPMEPIMINFLYKVLEIVY